MQESGQTQVNQHCGYLAQEEAEQGDERRKKDKSYKKMKILNSQSFSGKSKNCLLRLFWVGAQLKTCVRFEN